MSQFNTLAGLVLKEEQKSAVEALLLGKDGMAVLPNGFGKFIIYQSFVLPKTFRDSHLFVSIVPLRSIIEDQLHSNDFGLKEVALEKNQQLLKDIADNRFQVIFSSVEQALPLVFETYFTHEAKIRDIDFLWFSPSASLA